MSEKNKTENTNSKYYDVYRYRKICDLMTAEFYKGIKELEEYIEDYPVDTSALTYYAANLITIKKYKEAEIILNEALRVFSNRKYKDKKKEEIFIESYVISKLRLLCHKEEYSEALRMIREYHNVFINTDVNIVGTRNYCRLKLNLPVNFKENDNYFPSQMLNYNEDLLKEHIRKHQMKYEIDVDKNTSSKFYENFPIDEVMNEVKKYFTEEYSITPGFYENVYYFRYDNNGKSIKEKDRSNLEDGYLSEQHRAKTLVTNYFKVITFKNTHDIITICPCESNRGFQYIDLNYLSKKEDNKIKRKSQIDKFNERYGIKK